MFFVKPVLIITTTYKKRTMFLNFLKAGRQAFNVYRFTKAVSFFWDQHSRASFHSTLSYWIGLFFKILNHRRYHWCKLFFLDFKRSYKHLEFYECFSKLYLSQYLTHTIGEKWREILHNKVRPLFEIVSEHFRSINSGYAPQMLYCS